MNKVLISILALSCMSAQVPAKAIDWSSSLSGILTRGYKNIKVATMCSAMCAGFGHIVAKRFFGHEPMMGNALTLSAAAIGFSLPWMYKYCVNWRKKVNGQNPTDQSVKPEDDNDTPTGDHIDVKEGSDEESLNKTESEIISLALGSIDLDAMKACVQIEESSEGKKRLVLNFVMNEMREMAGKYDPDISISVAKMRRVAFAMFKRDSFSPEEEFGKQMGPILRLLSSSDEPEVEALLPDQESLMPSEREALLAASQSLLEKNDHRNQELLKIINDEDRPEVKRGSFLDALIDRIPKASCSGMDMEKFRGFVLLQQCPILQMDVEKTAVEQNCFCNYGLLAKRHGPKSVKAMHALHCAMVSYLFTTQGMLHF